MRILGLETSCDDSAAAVYDTERGILAHAQYSQIGLHAQYGGVVPELASRDHVQKLLPLVENTLSQAKLTPDDLDGLAYTAGPGLAGTLLVGTALGHALAWAWELPAVAVHHMEGHLLSPQLEDNAPAFPFLALLVSGGHTLMADVQGIGQYRILGESLDDAVGEAFDKTAKLLGLGYPGGPAISRAAEQGTAWKYKLPRPMTDRPGLDFSFSGLKTAVSDLASGLTLDPQNVADIAWAFQDAAIDTLCIKCKRALEQTEHKRLVVAGGVSANRELRERLKTVALDRRAQLYFPRPEFSTDNAAMIAYAGALRLQAGQKQELAFEIHPRWRLDELEAVT